jgi:class 3 adenylate cyclase
MLLAEGDVVTAADLDLPDTTGRIESPRPAESGAFRTSIDTVARGRIEEALRETQGNVTAAADKLGIPRSTLRYQLDRLGIAGDRDTRPKPRAAAPARPLAERILAPTGVIAGERKQVTVLCADFRESLARVADDPELTQRLADAVLERLMDAVRRHGGTVNQVRGDGIMALFGAPLALEDHAVRACNAALAMREVVLPRGGDVPIKVGLHSGDVVLRTVGGEARLDYAAVRPRPASWRWVSSRSSPSDAPTSSSWPLPAGLARGSRRRSPAA